MKKVRNCLCGILAFFFCFPFAAATQDVKALPKQKFMLSFGGGKNGFDKYPVFFTASAGFERILLKNSDVAYFAVEPKFRAGYVVWKEDAWPVVSASGPAAHTHVNIDQTFYGVSVAPRFYLQMFDEAILFIDGEIGSAWSGIATNISGWKKSTSAITPMYGANIGARSNGWACSAGFLQANLRDEINKILPKSLKPMPEYLLLYFELRFYF
jgi:hypothetical protein